MLLLALIFQLNLYIYSTSSLSIIQDHQLLRKNYATRSTTPTASITPSTTTTTSISSLIDQIQWNRRTQASPRALKITSSIASQFIDTNGSNDPPSIQDPLQTASPTQLIRDNKMPPMFNDSSETEVPQPTDNYVNSNVITRGDVVDSSGDLLNPLDEVEMFTNNHQSVVNENSINNHNSRHYDNHYYHFGGSNPSYYNKHLTNHGGPIASTSTNNNNNVFGNNFNLNYIHSLLMKPMSNPVSSSTALLNVYSNNNPTTASSSGYISPYISASVALSNAVNNLQQTINHKQQQLVQQIQTSTTPSSSSLAGAEASNQDLLQHHDYTTIGDFPGSTICGRQQVGYREPRIVGGNHTYEGEFPWAVSIQRHGNHHCGGVIVGRRWILTAAHCVRSQLVGNLIIRTGGHTLSRSSNNLNSHLERDYFVEQIVMHEDFSRYDNLTASQMKSSANTNNADIALLKLKHDIHWNELAWPVCFPNKRAGNFSGHDAIVIGWGKLNEKSEDFSNDLQKVKLTIIDNKVCQNWFRQAGREMPIDERIICAGFKNGGKDACHGDSGGPLLSRINGQYVVVGVVSTGIGCARPLLPGLYSRVSSYISWIEKYVND